MSIITASSGLVLLLSGISHSPRVHMTATERQLVWLWRCMSFVLCMPILGWSATWTLNFWSDQRKYDVSTMNMLKPVYTDRHSELLLAWHKPTRRFSLDLSTTVIILSLVPRFLFFFTQEKVSLELWGVQASEYTISVLYTMTPSCVLST